MYVTTHSKVTILEWKNEIKNFKEEIIWLMHTLSAALLAEFKQKKKRY